MAVAEAPGPRTLTSDSEGLEPVVSGFGGGRGVGVGVTAVLQLTSPGPGCRSAPGPREQLCPAGTWGPQSDDVVESTTSRPLQTVGTNWEPEPRKGSQRSGPTPRSFPESRQQRRQECGGDFLPLHPSLPSPASSKEHSTSSQRIPATQGVAPMWRS